MILSVDRMPKSVREELVARASEDAPVTIKAIMEEVKTNITECFDIEHMVYDHIHRHRRKMT
jgi:hypothetical protein